jgi:hypothetical protein
MKKELTGIQNQLALFIWIYKQFSTFSLREKSNALRLPALLGGMRCQNVATAVISRLQTP